MPPTRSQLPCAMRTRGACMRWRRQRLRNRLLEARNYMIGSVRGRISSKTPPQLMVDVGGVGYELEAPLSTFFHLPAIGQEVRLLTHLVVREDAHVLYAFATEDERRLFRSLIKVSGVGPKIALALLSGISVSAFAQCVLDEDIGTLTRVPGVGRKTAERLIVEMRDRLAAPQSSEER